MADLDDLLADLGDDSMGEQDSSHEEIDEEHAARDLSTNTATSTPVDGNEAHHEVGQLLQSKRMQEVLTKIDDYSSKEQRRILGIVEADPEYQLIIKANNVSMEIDDEIKRVVEFVKQRYAVRFSELEKIVVSPLQYVRTVRAIGNEEDLVHLKLNHIVGSSLDMSIKVTATTSDGRSLTSDELDSIYRACDVAIELDAAKTKIIDYVQSRIETIAPNVTKIVGAMTAAKLIAQAGGLSGLARCPSCNVPSLGKKQGIMNGFSRLGSQAQGFLYYCELVQSVPEDVRKQAQRQVAAKVILAARIDSAHESLSGEQGLQFKDELLRKMDKLSEPPDLKDVKALPAPDDPARSRRGGKKVRKAKERYATTEMAKLRNRMAFGKAETETTYGEDTEGLGMLDAASTIRAPKIDKRTRAKLPKAKTKGGQLTGISALFSDRPDTSLRLPTAGGSTSISGMQSSLRIGSAQGIELPSLNLDSLKKKSDDKWFAGGTFTELKRP